MMRCIEEAIRGGQVSREQGRELNDRVEEMLRQGLTPETLRGRLAEELEHEARDRKRRALLQEVRRQVLTETLLTYRNARGENDPGEALWMLMSNFVHGKVESIDLKRQAILGQAHGELTEMLEAFQKGWVTGDLRRRRASVRADLEKVVRELHEEDTGDPRAKELAQGYRDVSEKLRHRINAAGARIGKLDDWGLPHWHDREALLRIGQESWVDYLMRDGVLDRARMVSERTGEPMTDEALREGLRVMWKRTTTDGWIDNEPGYQAWGRGALGKRWDDRHRWLHFKSADEWLAYSRQFGEGDPFVAMTGHLGKMARDIATLEVLGPNPEAMRNYLKQLVLKTAASSEPIQRVVSEAKIKLGKLTDKLQAGERGQGLVEHITRTVNELADARRRERAAAGGHDADHFQTIQQEAQAKLDAATKDLAGLEAFGVSEERAALEMRLRELEGQRKIIEGKSAPQLGGGVSRRNRRRLEEIKAETAKIEARQKAIEADGWTTIADADPATWREIQRTIYSMRDEALRIDLVGSPEGFRAVADPMDTARRAIAKHDAMWEVLRGTAFAPVNSRAANILQATRNWMSAALLGSAAVTAFGGDMATNMYTRVLSGMDMNVLKVLVGNIKMWSVTPGSAERQRMAIRAGLTMDSALHVMHQYARYAETMGAGGMHDFNLGSLKTTRGWAAMTGYVADRVISLTGLADMTQAAKHAFGLDMQAHFADRVHLAFDKLDPVTRKLLERHGITDMDWAVMRGAALYEPHGDAAGWLRPNEIAALPGGREVAEKYLAMIYRQTRRAILEGTVETRVAFGGGRPGTFIGEVSRNLNQFKAFSVANVLLHLRDIQHVWQAGDRGLAVGRAASMAIVSALGGAFVLELYELINGRDPKLLSAVSTGKNPGAKYWVEAIMKAGGLGIFGDFLNAPISQFGGGAIDTAAGPVAGELERIRRGSLNDLQDWLNGESKRPASRFWIQRMRELTPGRTAWYLRLLSERYGMNQLQLALDPGARRVFEQHEKLQKKRDGNSYWWRAGETWPGRAPAPFGAAP